MKAIGLMILGEAGKHIALKAIDKLDEYLTEKTREKIKEKGEREDVERDQASTVQGLDH